jgi:hypothetical protein
VVFARQEGKRDHEENGDQRKMDGEGVEGGGEEQGMMIRTGDPTTASAPSLSRHPESCLASDGTHELRGQGVDLALPDLIPFLAAVCWISQCGLSSVIVLGLEHAGAG